MIFYCLYKCVHKHHESVVRNIKQDFETVVRENMPWLLRFVKSKLNNHTIAEDLVQEIWIRAFRAYDTYYDHGKIQAWLMRIAQNHLRNYFSQLRRMVFVSLDADSDENDSLYTYLSDGETPEDEYIREELIKSVMDVISKLPERQAQIITYRFIEDKKLSEIADIMNIPQGTVKSSMHYALDEIRKRLGIVQNKHQKGDRIMDCRDIYKYLFIYTNNTITSEDKASVEAHISTCKDCTDIVSALEKLIPKMVFAGEDEMSHFLIDFPELHLSYCGMRYEIPDYERLNKYLSEWNGNIPEGVSWLCSGFGKVNTLVAMFDNEGNEIKFKVFDDDGSHYRIKATYLQKVYRYMWDYQMFTYENSPYGIKEAKEAPNLYYGNMHNCFGSNIKSALYQAIPGTADNIRIKRGNGFIDGGTYKFPYADRYVTEEERISLDYSFVLGK